MIMYMGNSIASKNRKKRRRSIERNTPSSAVSSARNATMRLRTLRTSLRDASTAMGNRNVVMRTSHRLMPSTPTMYRRPMEPTQPASWTCWKPGTLRLNVPRTASESANVTSVVARATVRARDASMRGHARSTTIPASGTKIVAEST